MTYCSCYYSFFLMIKILLLLLCHNNSLVHSFPNLLIQSEIGCMTELSVDEVIMNNQVVPYEKSKEKDVKIAYRISEEDEWIVPSDNDGIAILDSIPTADIKLKLVLPDSLKGVQYVVEIMEAGSESAASFPNGGCEGNIRDSEKVPTKRGKEKGISLKITDGFLKKKEVKIIAGWATGHSAVSLTEPIIFKLAGTSDTAAAAAAGADGEKKDEQQQKPKEEGQPPKPALLNEGSPPKEEEKPKNEIIEKCEDIDVEHCADWTSRGECDNNVIYMLKHCRKSCQVCFDHHPTVEQLRIMQEKEQKLMDALKELEEKEKKREQAQQEENERIMEEEIKAQQIEMAKRDQQAKEIREKTEKDRLEKEQRLQKDKADIEEMERQALERKERLHREEIFQQKKEDSLRKRKDKVKNEPLKKKKTTKKHAAHHNNNNNNKFVDEKIHQLGDKIEEYGDVLQNKMDEFGHKIKNTKLGKNIDSKIHKIKHNNKLIQKANRLLHEDGKYDHGKNNKDRDILEKVLTNKITQKIIYNYDDDSYGGGQTYDTDQHIVATIVYIISLIGTVMCCSFISNNKYSSYNKSHVT